VSGPRLLVMAAAALCAGALATARAQTPNPNSEDKRPSLGMQLSLLPRGPGKDIADKACLRCHSADILRQQRLSEKQWTASLTKMIGWGAEVPEDKRVELVAYLARNFGPHNDRFRPVVTRPLGR
jgi:quinoprotein glucose dehydrogenase